MQDDGGYSEQLKLLCGGEADDSEGVLWVSVSSLLAPLAPHAHLQQAPLSHVIQPINLKSGFLQNVVLPRIFFEQKAL